MWALSSSSSSSAYLSIASNWASQQNRFIVVTNSTVDNDTEKVVYADTYMLDNKMMWKMLPPMPKPNSHIESSWVLVNNLIIIVGGTTEKHPETKRMILVGEIFQFHLDSMKWFVIGKLPYRVKTTLAGFWEGWLYFTSGQRDRGPDNPQPKKVLGEMWRTKLRILVLV